MSDNNNNNENNTPKQSFKAKDFIKQSQEENKEYLKTMEEKENKKRKVALAIESVNKTRTEQIKNINTRKVIAEKTYYVRDSDDKTVYDYMQDPEITDILEFKVPEEDKDKKEGDPITALISVFSKNPRYL